MFPVSQPPVPSQPVEEKEEEKQAMFREKEYFKFISEKYPETSFIVTNFKGSEGISALYDFEIRLITKLTDEDAVIADSPEIIPDGTPDGVITNEETGDARDITLSESILKNPAVFIIKHPDLINTTTTPDYSGITSEGTSYPNIFEKIEGSFKDTKNAYFYGYPVSCSQGTQIQGYTVYTVRLRPVVDKLNHITQNTVFTNKTVIEIAESVLKSTKTFSIGYTFENLDATTYPSQEFSLQNNETSFNYISAKLEHDGIYYYYSNDNKLEQLVFMDNKFKHEENADVQSLAYLPAVSANDSQKGDIATSFVEVRTAVPKSVLLRDYAWMDPNKPLDSTAIISETGLGEVYLFGEGYSTTAEGDRLATLRAEEILCQSYNYIGTSAVPKLRPGYLFNLTGHFSERLNDQYMITEVSHEGNQEYLLSSIIGTSTTESSAVYHNSFKAIPSFIQYRPKRLIKRSTVSGLITGFVGSQTDDASLLDLDEYGRYKVDFPQSINSETSKSSCMLRRAQPSVGELSGSFYPLYPGTEVLVGFTNGHPDRPIIISPVSNTETGFVGQDGTSLSSVQNSEIVLNENGMFQLQSGAGTATSPDQDTISSCNNAANIVNGLDSGFATLSSTAAASYMSLLTANTDPTLLFLKLLGPTSTALGQALSAADAKDKGCDAAGVTFTTLGKILPIAFTITSKVKAHVKGACAYRASISSTENASTVALEANLNWKALSMIIASMVGHVLTSGMSAGFGGSSKNKDVSSQTDTYAKNVLITQRTLPNIGTMVTETVALAVLAYTKIMQNAKPRGGVSISSPDNNVIIGAKEEARLTSGKQVFIGANTALNALGALQLAELYAKTDSTVWGTGNPCGLAPGVNAEPRVGIVSKHILSGAEKMNRLLSLRELEITSGQRLAITNRSQDDALLFAEDLITLTGSLETKSPAVAKTAYPYSQIVMDNDPDESPFTMYTKFTANHESGLEFSEMRVELFYSDGGVGGRLSLENEETILSHAGESKTTKVQLDETSVSILVDKTKVILDSEKETVSVIADSDTSIILNAGGDIKTIAKTITSESSGAMKLTGKTFTADGGGNKLELAASGCKISCNLTVSGKVIQLA